MTQKRDDVTGQFVAQLSKQQIDTLDLVIERRLRDKAYSDEEKRFYVASIIAKYAPLGYDETKRKQRMKNAARRERDAALRGLGLKKVKGYGKTFWE